MGAPALTVASGLSLSAVSGVGLALIAAATLGGAVISRVTRRRPVAALVAVAAVLVAVVLGDLVPDLIGQLRSDRGTWWLAISAGWASFAGLGRALRRGCPCAADPARARPVGGAAVTAAIAVHRALEGSVVALTGSIPVLIGLALHAASEGMALTTLLAGQSRRRLAGWLVLACASPAVGAVLVSAVRLPSRSEPMLTAAVAGVLLRGATTSLQLAAGRGRSRSAPAEASALEGGAAMGLWS